MLCIGSARLLGSHLVVLVLGVHRVDGSMQGPNGGEFTFCRLLLSTETGCIFVVAFFSLCYVFGFPEMGGGGGSIQELYKR